MGTVSKMKDRVLKARTARAALVMLGLLGLAMASVMPVRAQETGATNAQFGPVVTAHLDYQEVSYSFANWGARVGSKDPTFKKEPTLSGSKVVRGTLQLGANPSEEMGFAWDRNAGKLYLDLNRNLDLTDDPVSVYPRQRGSGDNYQCFKRVLRKFL